MDNQQRPTNLNCLNCNRTFSQKSSLVRHRTICASHRPPNLRQKSCHPCSVAKARCDLQRPSCSRCTSRKVTCGYPSNNTTQGPSIAHGSPTASQSSLTPPPPPDIPYSTNSEKGEVQGYENSSKEPSDMLWSTNPPPKNLQDIPSRGLQNDQLAGVIGPFIDSPAEIAESTPEFENVEWMLSILPPLEPAIADTTPALAKNSMIFLLRVFRTWPNMISKGFQLPPLFHSTIIEKSPLPLPLANCFTLTKMWSGQYEGSDSIARETILKETKSLIHDLPTYDEIYLLAALQALTIYNIMLLFPSKDQNSIPELDQSIFHGLQQAVFRTAGTGLILQEETSSTIPSWEAWIHVTSKRRAVFVLYILHWAYSVYHHLPSFNCEEIGFMPGPAAKFLWNASSRQQWERLYSGWLLQWDGEPFLQHEFINVKPGVGVDRRVQLWLEDTDELGILFMSIVNTTEREPEFATNMYTARNGGIHIS